MKINETKTIKYEDHNEIKVGYIFIIFLQIEY